MPNSIYVRFWSNVNIPSNRNRAACWQWLGEINPDGQGVFELSNGDSILAPVLAYELRNATPISQWATIRQTCDDTLCCNPAHFVLIEAE